MFDSLHSWLSYLLRWGHVIAGISWIGSSFYFIWLDKALTLPEKPREGVESEVWMVHSGGFYRVERRKIGSGQMPKTLHWFKWEAAFTWLTGVLLMAVVYYSGGGALLFDSSNQTPSVSKAIIYSISLLPFSWFIYDSLWNSPLGKNTRLATFISCLLGIGLVYGLCQFFGGRAAYMHIGAIFGTIMVANVWVRILPAQQKMIAATEEGREPDYSLSAKAKLRSVHNSYLTLPVLFLMLSHHYPMTYGSEQNVLIFVFLFILGASVRHYKITKEKVGAIPALLMIGALVGLFYLTTETSEQKTAATSESHSKITVPLLDLSDAGNIQGVISFKGIVPSPKKIAVTPECISNVKKNISNETLLSQNGRLQNVFVWISEGMETKEFVTPVAEVIVDQRECAYHPRVIGVQVGQPLTFLNDDPFLHNIHSMAKENERFNISLAMKNSRVTRKLMKPEIMVRAKCDIHPWMEGFIGVVSHPYFSVSNEKGEMNLSQVPPGKYSLSAWHETLGLKTQEIVLSPKENMKIIFSFP